MKVIIKLEISNQKLSSLVRTLDLGIEKIFYVEEISFETDNESQENIITWLSEDRKKDVSK